MKGNKYRQLNSFKTAHVSKKQPKMVNDSCKSRKIGN